MIRTAARLPFDDNSFDAVTAFEVLEHVEDFAAEMAEMAEIVRCAREWVILSVPNCADVDSPLGRYNLALFHWTDRTHVRFFTEPTLRGALGALPLRIEEIRPIYRVDPNEYYWETIRLPAIIRKPAKHVLRSLAPKYDSSLLAVCRVV